MDMVFVLFVCIKWKFMGVCFWLKCVFIKCSVKILFCIQYYVFDVIVLMYYDLVNYFWGDVGCVVVMVSFSFGSVFLVMLLDSVGLLIKLVEIYNFCDVDMIGNLVGLLVNVLVGQLFFFLNLVWYFSVNELLNYFGIVSLIFLFWLFVLLQFVQFVQFVKLVVDLFNLVGKVNQVVLIVNCMCSVFNFGVNFGQVGWLLNMNIVQLGNFVNVIGVSGFILSVIFCFGLVSVFGLYFQLEIDSYFW